MAGFHDITTQSLYKFFLNRLLKKVKSHEIHVIIKGSIPHSLGLDMTFFPLHSKATLKIKVFRERYA